jgi:NAD(P)-dependent dehydrogenase (short-subunit alcohol dehydrogenase family)
VDLQYYTDDKFELENRMEKIALVTGGNRGLGLQTCLELVKQKYHVILTCRDRQEGEKLVAELKQKEIQLDFMQLDVTDSVSIEGLAKHVEKKFGRLDVLVNNAGMFVKGKTDTFSATLGDLKKTMETNTFGAFEMCKAFVPLMQKNGYGRIVNVSSGMGQLSEMGTGYPAYRLSKTALNAVTKIFAAEVAGSDILVNSVCPGWVRTDMGGPNAERSIEQGASGIVWAATIPKGGPTGGFFRDGKPLPW